MRVPIPIQMSITLVQTWFDLTRYFLLVGRSFAPQIGRAELKIGDSCVIKKEGGGIRYTTRRRLKMSTS